MHNKRVILLLTLVSLLLALGCSFISFDALSDGKTNAKVEMPNVVGLTYTRRLQHEKGTIMSYTFSPNAFVCRMFRKQSKKKEIISDFV